MQVGKTALMWAAAKEQMEVFAKLAELGADLNKADRVSETCSNYIWYFLLQHCHAHPVL